ncbi:hypothetical protein QTH87_11240 [Variovorax sp. J22P168]|uniref:hypothetical protein n=1 Tax=Variovorax jilinensis TaxID=3053513 RepID=UPI002574C469|nr:hypothetical protein [Variovorax sp. J22P168]MDM0013006.1 hypothetical protein [Variovorax sp. J22P168]
MSTARALRIALACAAAWVGALDVAAAPASVTLDNQSRTTACAEEDNVSMALSGRGIARFRVEALQPPYLAAVAADTTAPDFSNCNFDGGAHPTDPSHAFVPRRVVLHDDRRWLIVGITLPSFWRPNRVPVTLGTRTEDDIHLLQVFARQPGARKPLEALVVYPADGYWRAKPLPLARFGDGVYGSSFLLGPVEHAGRPLVNIAAIEVTLAPLAFALRFADGGTAQVKVVEVSRKRTALDVTLQPPSRPDRPFAVLRSMFVSADNADVAEVGFRAAPSAARRTLALDDVTTLEADELRFGRSLPSRHNTSAPDLHFSRFSTAAP